MPRINLFRKTPGDWFVTLGRAEPSRLTHDNSAQTLIDNETTLKKVVEAVNGATRSVYLMQFEYQPDYVAVYDSVAGVPRPKEKLTEVLREAAERGVQVYVMLNSNLVAPDSYNAISDAFSDTSVHVRGFPAHGPHAMHAKTLIVDDAEVLIIGSPFRQDFWDTREHILHDPRRGSENVQPKHDVSICLRGSAVAYVREYFVQLWNYLSDTDFEGSDKIAPGMPHGLSAGGLTIQIIRSVTPKTLTKKGETSILEAYRRAISKAEDWIYLENQYFTNKSIADALRKALKDRPELQLILLINQTPDVPSYRQRQNANLKRLGLNLRRPLIDHPRIGVFTLWSKALETDTIKLGRCYIHSKVGIVDDMWATIGSANLDGPSLEGAEEFKLFVNPKNHLSMEINAVLLDKDDSVKPSVKGFRSSLWSEHLELSGHILSGPRPSGGWLGLWKKIAAGNVTSLKGPEPTMNGRILPYSTEVNVKKQLVEFGVPIDELDVVTQPVLSH